MVAKMNPKAAMPKQSNKAAPSPSGKPTQKEVKEIETPASKAKEESGSAFIGSGIGNTT